MKEKIVNLVWLRIRAECIRRGLFPLRLNLQKPLSVSCSGPMLQLIFPWMLKLKEIIKLSLYSKDTIDVLPNLYYFLWLLCLVCTPILTFLKPTSDFSNKCYIVFIFLASFSNCTKTSNHFYKVRPPYCSYSRSTNVLCVNMICSPWYQVWLQPGEHFALYGISDFENDMMGKKKRGKNTLNHQHISLNSRSLRF